MLSPNPPPSFYSFVRYASLALAFSVLLWSVGCSSKGSKDSVSGKVTLNGQKVAGTVYFTGPDKKTVNTPIGPDGSYVIENPSKGENVITVKGMGAATGSAPASSFAPVNPDKDGALMKDKSGKMDMGAPPPGKYATDAGGLKYTVKGGRETYNIELTP